MTQIQQARSGKITEEMRQAAANEGVDANWLREEVALGRIIIPKNVNHNIVARGIGNGLKTKVNANIGTSELHCNVQEELEKLDIAVKYDVDSVMDLSTCGNLNEIRKLIINRSPVMVGTVPIYAVMSRLIEQNCGFSAMTADMLFNEIENQAEMGVDFMTLHCGVTRRSLKFLDNDPRIIGVVSRGGSLLKRWMINSSRENPLFEQYDRVLDICEKYDVTISLGDGIRPGAGADATDRGQLAELLVLGELTERALKRGVQVLVEGPGHMPLDEIEMNVRLMKKICSNVPFYVLGPLCTDIAPGYDHIVGAIGGALAASFGADFLCYVTPAEHLCLPDVDDVKSGVIASKIAAHSADIVKGIKGASERDLAISRARRELNWAEIYNSSIDPEYARKRKESSAGAGKNVCTMCGHFCAVKTDSNLD